MGQAHVETLSRALQAEAKGKFYIQPKLRFFTSKDGKSIMGLEEGPEVAYELRERGKDNRLRASFKVQSLPGCCGVLLMHSFTGDPDGACELIKIGCTAAQRTGYGLAALTLRAGSEIIPKLEGFFGGGWTQQAFLNGKTDNEVILLIKILPQDRKEKKVRATEGE